MRMNINARDSSGGLCLSDLTVRLGGGLILQLLNVEFEPAKLHLVLGANGSGKTTLLRAMGGLLPYQGHIRLGGREIRAYTSKMLARQLSWVPQQIPQAGGLSLRQYVLMGRFPYLNWLGNYAAQDHQQAEESLEIMQIGHLADRSWMTCSGGEQQKAAVARALCQDTEFIFLDEPAQSLDPLARQLLFKHLVSLADRGKTLVCSTHHLEALKMEGVRGIASKKGELVFDTKQDNWPPSSLEIIYGAPDSDKIS